MVGPPLPAKSATQTANVLTGSENAVDADVRDGELGKCRSWVAAAYLQGRRSCLDAWKANALHGNGEIELKILTGLCAGYKGTIKRVEEWNSLRWLFWRFDCSSARNSSKFCDARLRGLEFSRCDVAWVDWVAGDAKRGE